MNPPDPGITPAPRPRPLARLRRWCARLLQAIGLLVLVVTFTPITGWWGRMMGGPFHDPPGDVLLVLSGSQWKDGTLGYSSLLRTRYALWALRSGGFQEVVISGGGSPSAAGEMKRLMVFEGADPARIRVEEKSLSTHQNAQGLGVMLRGDGRRLVLLTSDYHMFRASRALRKAGLEFAERPIPDAVKRNQSISTRWPAFTDLATESAKIVYYQLRGWM